MGTGTGMIEFAANGLVVPGGAWLGPVMTVPPVEGGGGTVALVLMESCEPRDERECEELSDAMDPP